MAFDTKELPFDTTLARQIAKQHLDLFNNVYWVGERSYPLTIATPVLPGDTVRIGERLF